MEKVNIKERSWRKAEVYSNEANGLQFIDSLDPFVGHVLPADKAHKKNSLMLDLGTSHGNWMVAGAKKKYIPIGVNVSVDQANIVLEEVRRQDVNGYVVVAGLDALPFQNDLFDLIWSSKVLRPDSDEELLDFSEQLYRIMAKSGKLKLPFEKKFSIAAYELQLGKRFPNVSSRVHSYFGAISHQENFSKANLGRKAKVGASLTFEFFSRLIPTLKSFSDSIYIKAQKITGPQNLRISHFLKHHWLKENLNVVYLMQCPISGGPLYLSKDSHYVISDNAGVKYPVINEIPVMLQTAAVPLEVKSYVKAEVKE